MRKEMIRGRVFALGLLLALLSCVPPQGASKASDPALQGRSLAEVMTDLQTLDRVVAPPADLESTLVFRPRDPQKIDEIVGRFHRWCATNGGVSDDIGNLPLRDCEQKDLGPDCLNVAERWYSSAQNDVESTAAENCRPRSTDQANAMILWVVTKTPADSLVALYSTEQLTAFMRKYTKVGDDYRAAKVAAASALISKKAAADKSTRDPAIGDLDASKDPALANVPSARESVDFIIEKLERGVGATRKSTFGTSPCVFNLRSSTSENYDDPIDMRTLNLNAVEAVTEGKVLSDPEHSAADFATVFQVVLEDNKGRRALDFGERDIAARVSKAFIALGRRCGAKMDTRFK